MRTNLSVDGLLRASALRWGDKIAIESGEGRISYDALDRLVDKAAAFLRRQGAAPGDRVGLSRRDSISYIAWFFAISRCGAVLIPLNPALSEAECAYICGNATVSIVLCDPAFRDKFEAVSCDGGHSFRVCEALAPAGIDELEAPSSAVGPSIEWSAPHSILYTSGTTGRPKGAVLSHRTRIVNSMSGRIGYGVSHDTRLLLAAPMFHSGGMILGLINVLSAGGTLILARDAHVDTLRAHVVEDRPNHLVLVPTVVYRMVTSEAFCAAARDVDMALLHGASPMSQGVIERLRAELPRCRPYHAYGSTEACQVTVLPPDEYFRFPTVTGRALPGVDLRVVDESGNPVEPGVVGEVVTAGAHVFDGYLNDPAKTADAMRDGMFWTGDLATANELGHISIVSRKSDLIISGGYNVYPSEVEAAIEAHPAVQQAAVFSVPDDEWGEKVCAAVILKPEVYLGESDLKTFLGAHLAKYKQPKSIVFESDLPRTAVGKIQKHKLKEIFQDKV